MRRIGRLPLPPGATFALLRKQAKANRLHAEPDFNPSKVWDNARNLLLCCAECGRLKGKQFPLDETNNPLLLDPTSDDPWRYLDFDPETGNIVPRFDIELNAFSRKGDSTVAILNLDRREALARVYLRTYRRLAKIIAEAIDDTNANADYLVERLRAADDHGLIAWCIHGIGQTMDPFCVLRDIHPDVWGVCCECLP